MSISIEADLNNLGRSSRADRLPREIHPTLSSKLANPRRRRAGWRLCFTSLDEAKKGKMNCFVKAISGVLKVVPYIVYI